MIEIIQAREEHIALLPEIELEAASQSSLDDLPEHLRSQAMPLHKLEAVHRQGLLLVAIENGDTPVGFAAAEIIDRYLHLLEIDVVPRAQGLGIGTSLLDKVMESGLRRNLQWVSLTTFSHLPWNAPWYEKKGFRKIEAQSLPAFLADILRAEKALGLDPNKRVAMRKELHPQV